MNGGSFFGQHKEGSRDETEEKRLKDYAIDDIKKFISNWYV